PGDVRPERARGPSLLTGQDRVRRPHRRGEYGHGTGRVAAGGAGPGQVVRGPGGPPLRGAARHHHGHGGRRRRELAGRAHVLEAWGAQTSYTMRVPHALGKSTRGRPRLSQGRPSVLVPGVNRPGPGPRTATGRRGSTSGSPRVHSRSSPAWR